jgi:tetratricopeptide (TPR) repeat protein
LLFDADKRYVCAPAGLVKAFVLADNQKLDQIAGVSRVNLEFAWALTRAGVLHVLGFSRQALAVYREILQHRNDAPSARAAAILSAKEGDLLEAEHWYAKAAEWEPDDIETWFNLGYLRDALGRKREAIDAFRETVRLAPNFERAWHGIGSMHIDLSEHALAIEPLRHAHALQPLNPQPLYQIGLCQHICGNDHAVHDVVQELVTLDVQRARELIEETGRKGLRKLLPVD